MQFTIQIQASETHKASSLNIPPVLHYIIYHNVTSDGEQGICANDANVTINVTNDQFDAMFVYAIQIAAVNIIGQGSISETTLGEFLLSN